MLLEANDEGCIDQIAVIAAVLSIRDPRERPLAKTAAADQMHARFDDAFSDFTTLLNICTQKKAPINSNGFAGNTFCLTIACANGAIFIVKLERF